MPLNKTEITVWEVEYQNLAEYIAECYGLPQFEILPESNDSYKKQTVTAQLPEWESDKNELTAILTCGGCELYQLHMVLDKMCHDGFLEPGTYLISISW
jgi:hypothetical protein